MSITLQFSAHSRAKASFIIYQTHLSMRKIFYIPSYIPTGVICFQVLSIKFCTLLDKHSKRILLGPSFEFVCFNHEFSVSVNIAFSRYWLVSNVFKVTLFLFWLGSIIYNTVLSLRSSFSLPLLRAAAKLARLPFSF